MEIFKGRHVCLLCFFFMLGSFLATLMLGGILRIAIVVLTILSVLAIFLVFCFKRYRLTAITVLLCVLAVLFSLLHSFLRIALPQERAGQFVGERAVLCYIVTEKYHTTYSSQYEVRILQIDDQSVDVHGVLICGFETELSPGDQICARVSLKETGGDSSSRRDGLLLNAYLDDGEGAYVQRISKDRGIWETLCSEAGFRIVSDRIQTVLGNRLEELLGRESGTLASGFLMGDRSRVTSDVIRDFRRSGTSHQMAVSGLHISVLLGSIELLLRRLCVAKSVRCITVSFLSVGFLFLTGFSLSACRSVLMLYAVYMSYLLYDDHDSLTALFVSITVILLASPYAVYDLGMWMSFFATLGVLTVYPLCEANIPYPHKSKGMKRKLLRLCRALLLAALMTVIANMFLLLLIWIFFGEVSLVAVPANLALSVPAYLFLIGTPLLLLLGAVPLLGTLLAWGIGGIGWLILRIVACFSLVPGATLSLNYGFSGVIIKSFTVIFAIFLVIRLPQRRLLFLPPATAVLAFVICLCVYHGVHREPTVTYSYTERGELITVSEGVSVSFCDISSGFSSGYSVLYGEMCKTRATEISALTLTHYHEGHRAMVELCANNLILRKLYLPTPRDEVENAFAKELWTLAKERKIETVFYDWDAVIQLTNSVRAKANIATKESCPPLLLSIYSKDGVLTYLSPSACQTAYREIATTRMTHSETVVFGSHGASGMETYFFDLSRSAFPKRIVYATAKIHEKSRCVTGNADILVPSSDDAYRISFSLN